MNSRLAGLLLAVVLVGSVLAPAAAAGTPEVLTHDADLAIEQESYVGTDVQRGTANGTVLYEVQGQTVDIHPQNFDPGAVVDFGVTTPTGQLDYQPDLGQFTFTSDGATGTFELYWIAAETVAVNETVTANNTTETRTTTETRQVRYEAVVRVTDQATVRVVAPDRYDQVQEDAENWSAFATAARQLRDDAMLIPDSASVDEVAQTMFASTRSVRDPAAFFTGSFTSWLIMSLMTVGGLVGILLVKGPAVTLYIRVRGQLNRWESIEAEEGDLTEKDRQLADAQRLEVAQNTDIQDIYDDPHRAEAMLPHGPTFHDATQNIKAWLGPKVVRARLAEAGQNGLVAVVDRTGDHITDVELREDDDTLDVDDGRLVDLTGAAEGDRYADDLSAWDVMDALPREEARKLDDYDFTSDAWDPDDLALEDAALDLDAWLQESGVDDRYFESAADYGATLRRFVRAYRQHPVTDEDGAEKGDRLVLNEMLQALQLNRDVFEMPIAEWLLEGVEEAIRQDDPVADAQTTITAAQQGTLSGDD